MVVVVVCALLLLLLLVLVLVFTVFQLYGLRERELRYITTGPPSRHFYTFLGFILIFFFGISNFSGEVNY